MDVNFRHTRLTSNITGRGPRALRDSVKREANKLALFSVEWASNPLIPIMHQIIEKASEFNTTLYIFVL